MMFISFIRSWLGEQKGEEYLTQLAKRAGGKFPADLMARVIDGRAEVKAHGGRDMPVWGDYFAAEKPEASGVVKEAEAQARIGALVAYLASIQAK